MSNIIRVAGLDPSLSNFGMVKGDLCIDTGHFTPTDISLIETTPPSKSTLKKVRKNSIDLNRCRLLHKNMHEFISDCKLVFIELPVGSQTARAMASYGACIALAASLNTPLIQVTATEVKMAGAGLKTATKKQMIDWATNQYPNLNWFTKKVKGIKSFVNKNEHIADAIAAVHAGVETEQFKQLQAIQF